MVNPQTGRVHTSFNQTGTATGPASAATTRTCKTSRSAPRRDAACGGRSSRRGYKLLAVDYSQVELRILAHYVAGRGAAEGLPRGEDIHRGDGGSVYGVPLEQVTYDQRASPRRSTSA